MARNYLERKSNVKLVGEYATYMAVGIGAALLVVALVA